MGMDEGGMGLHIIDGSRGELNDAGALKVMDQVVCFNDLLPYPVVGEAYNHVGVRIQRLGGSIAADRSIRDQCIDLGLCPVPDRDPVASIDQCASDARAQ